MLYRPCVRITSALGQLFVGVVTLDRAAGGLAQGLRAAGVLGVVQILARVRLCSATMAASRPISPPGSIRAAFWFFTPHQGAILL
jgi:hypothetical protein